MATRTRAGYGAASVVMFIATAIAAVIAVGILLVLISANRQNDVVDFVMDIGNFFADPFSDLFPQDNVKQDYLVNWGLAAIVYLVAGAIIARIIRRV